MECPNCKEAQSTQSIKMLCMTQTNTGSAIAVGGGVASGLGVGAAKITTKSGTNLAATFIPDAKPAKTDAKAISTMVSGILISLFGIGGMTVEDPGAIEGGAIVIIFGLVVIGVGWHKLNEGKKSFPSRMKSWEDKVAFFEKGWICNRCGHTWIPSQGK